MRPRLLADADFNNKIVSGLRRREPDIDIIGPHEAGIIGASDPEVIQVACQLGQVLLSHDRRTMPAHFTGAKGSKPGLILVRQTADPGAVIDDLLLIWSATTAAEWTDQIAFLPL